MEQKKKRARSRGNGQGTVYKLPNGKWRAEVTLGWDTIKDPKTGKEKKKRIPKTRSGFIKKSDAIAALKEMGSEEAGINRAITFKGLYDVWSVPHYAKVSNDTSNGYKAAYRHCEPLWYRQFAQIKAADLQAVVDACQMSRRTKSDIKFLMAMLYKYAIQNDYCDKDYSKFIKLPKKEKSKRDAFTPDEIKKLWDAQNKGNKFVGNILVMVYTGMRYGEWSRVTKEMVDLDARTITGAGIKTEAGRSRVIPIADCIFPIIETMYNKASKKLLTDNEKVFYNSFCVTLQELDIRPLTPHCCRHTFATLMAEANIQPAIIVATTGHEKYLTTLQYTHITDEDKLRAVNQLLVPSSSSE